MKPNIVNIISGLQIISNYADNLVYAEHDYLYAGDLGHTSAKDYKNLLALGWVPNKELDSWQYWT